MEKARIRFSMTLTAALLALPVAAATPSPESQIAAALAPAPEEMRAGATVKGYDADGDLVVLRPGEGDLVCLGDDPTDERFHAACYHRDLESFMARGRALRAEGKERPEILETRGKEIEAGTLAMPAGPSMLYSLTGKLEDFDRGTNELASGRRLFVIYIPYATEASTGLSPQQMVEGAPWIMAPGTPWSHIMIVQQVGGEDVEE